MSLSMFTAVLCWVLFFSNGVVVAAGQLMINNHCQFPVYAWTVGDSMSAMDMIAPQGGQLAAPYVARASGGISVKLALEPVLKGATPITQVEYTLNSDTGLIWYDLSHVNGNVFAAHRVILHPIAAWHATCGPVDCPAGQICRAAYTTPDDNWATHCCPDTTDLIFDMCTA